MSQLWSGRMSEGKLFSGCARFMHVGSLIVCITGAAMKSQVQSHHVNDADQMA